MGTQIRLFDLTGLSTFAVPADPAEDTLSTWRFMGSPNASCTVTAQSVAGTLRVVENECDKTILLGGNPVAVRTSNQFVLSGSTIRVMNPVGEAVATVADLTTSVFDARMADGTGVWVVAAGATHGEWRLDKTSVLAVNGATVVATLSGVGRWIYFGAGAGAPSEFGSKSGSGTLVGTAGGANPAVGFATDVSDGLATTAVKYPVNKTTANVKASVFVKDNTFVGTTSRLEVYKNGAGTGVFLDYAFGVTGLQTVTAAVAFTAGVDSFDLRATNPGGLNEVGKVLSFSHWADFF